MAWIRHLKYLALVRNQESRERGVPWYAMLSARKGGRYGHLQVHQWQRCCCRLMRLLLFVATYMGGVDSGLGCDGGPACSNGSVGSAYTWVLLFVAYKGGVDSCDDAFVFRLAVQGIESERKQHPSWSSFEPKKFRILPSFQTFLIHALAACPCHR